DDITGLDIDHGAEPLERHDEKVDGARADGAAAGKRDARRPPPRKQRSDHPKAGPHLRDELIRGRGVDDLGRGEAKRLAGFGALARTLAVDRIVDAVIGEDTQQSLHIGKARYVLELERI